MLLATVVAAAVRGIAGAAAPSVGEQVLTVLIWVGMPLLLAGVPGAALIVALVWHRPRWVRLTAFAVAGVAFGLLVRGRGLSVYALFDSRSYRLVGWLDLGIAVTAAAACAVTGCAVVWWRVARNVGAGSTSGGEQVRRATGALEEGPGSPGARATRRATGEAAWAGPLAWLVGAVGIVMIPAYLAFAAMITAAPLFGVPGDLEAAAGYLWRGAAVAGAATAIVVVVASVAGRRGTDVRGRVALVAVGAVVTFVLVGAAASSV
ncbi:hypothetical protein [Isoptericola haloaureus]|uniref:Uncharacterized protein n=1 Tax=Isoptericola haloaureus TaxID=1542902 RepID=A0ABU7ZAW0_9MICO